MNRFPTFRRTPVTFLLVLTIVAIHEALWVAGGNEAAQALGRTVSPDVFELSGWWKCIASGLVHRDWEHLGGNALCLLAFGIWLEPRLGRWRTLALTLAATVASDAAGYLLELQPGYGASGIVYGFVGALASRPFWRGEDGRQYYGAQWLFWVTVVVTSIEDGAAALEVSHAGHLGGLVVGLCAGAVRWREDPRVVPAASRLRHALGIAGVLLVFGLAEATQPRWWIAREAAAAERAEQDGALDDAGGCWATLVCIADLDREYDAWYVRSAASYWMRHHDWQMALDLLATVAPSTETSEVYYTISWIRAYKLDPPDFEGAMDAWRRAYDIDPDDPRILHHMAQVRAFAEDTLVYHPRHARELARRAVYLDHMENAWYMRTLARALFDLNEYDQAFRWMDKAMARADSAQKVTFEEDLDWMREWLRDNASGVTAASAS